MNTFRIIKYLIQLFSSIIRTTYHDSFTKKQIIAFSPDFKVIIFTDYMTFRSNYNPLAIYIETCLSKIRCLK